MKTKTRNTTKGSLVKNSCPAPRSHPPQPSRRAASALRRILSRRPSTYSNMDQLLIGVLIAAFLILVVIGLLSW